MPQLNQNLDITKIYICVDRSIWYFWAFGHNRSLDINKSFDKKQNRSVFDDRNWKN